jgi:hypothetical protein
MYSMQVRKKYAFNEASEKVFCKVLTQDTGINEL